MDREVGRHTACLWLFCASGVVDSSQCVDRAVAGLNPVLACRIL